MFYNYILKKKLPTKFEYKKKVFIRNNVQKNKNNTHCEQICAKIISDKSNGKANNK